MDNQTAEPEALNSDATTSAETTATPAAAPADAPATGRKKFTDEQVTEMRSLRALKHPEGHDKVGKPIHSHKALADQFGTAAGVISQIVRNRVYKNPDYVPVNDGK